MGIGGDLVLDTRVEGNRSSLDMNWAMVVVAGYRVVVIADLLEFHS